MTDAGLHILLIEDDANDARMIKAALANKGGNPYRIELATSLSEALKRLARASFEIILLDLKLPDGKGVQSLGRSRWPLQTP